MKVLKVVLLIFAQVLIFSSCVTTKQTNLLQEPGGSIPSYPVVKGIMEYRIKPGDVLAIGVSFPKEMAETQRLFSLFSATAKTETIGNNDMGSLSVSPEGDIYFPYLGNINVANKTTTEVEEVIKNQLNENFISEEVIKIGSLSGCIVSVTLGNRYYSIIGAASAGRYSMLQEHINILQALAQSGDLDTYGNRAKVRILRETEGGLEQRIFDIRSEELINSEYYYIQPNDIIYVEPMSRRYFGMDSFSSVFGLITSVASIGITIYNLVKR